MRAVAISLTLLLLAAATAVGGSDVGLTAPEHAAADRVLATPPIPDLSSACETRNPYLVTACYKDFPDAGADPAAVVVFNNTDNDEPHYTVASESQVGAVWGLAYAARHSVIYAAAFHKRQMRFGPAGPGAIYRIDLSTGEVGTLAVVPNAGPDRHEASVQRGPDRAARDWAGKTSLGGLDASDDETELFVMNLADRRIYRFAIPDGTLMGSFPHGAAAADWADDARPFAVKYYNGRLYHGVVNAAENQRSTENLNGYVYSSNLDGTDMRMVAEFNLGYDRGTFRYAQYGPSGSAGRASLDWLPWVTTFRTTRDDGWFWFRPMPLIADIEFDSGADMIIGIKDRALDAGLTTRDLDDEVRDYLAAPRDMEFPAFGAGDTLIARRVGDRWDVATQPEFFEDGSLSIDETNLSGLAVLPTADEVVSAGVGFSKGWNRFPYWVDRGANWLRLDDGARVQRERICSTRVIQGICKILVVPTGDMGDMELLCGASPPTPTPTVTATSTALPTARSTGTRVPSATSTPHKTATATPTVTPTRAPTPIYLPLVLAEHCKPAQQPIDVALVIDASTSMRDDLTSAGRTKLAAAIDAARAFVSTMSLPRDQAAVVIFNDRAEVTQGLTGRGADVEAALAQLPRRVRQQTRIDLGIEGAHRELTSTRRKPGNRPVMILLTDGLANPEPASTAVRKARAAKDDLITIFTIGLGRPENLDVDELRDMANRPEYFYLAPDGEDLLEIYQTIAIEIPCPTEDFWGRR